jgi:hypothetical protein
MFGLCRIASGGRAAAGPVAVGVALAVLIGTAGVTDARQLRAPRPYSRDTLGSLGGTLRSLRAPLWKGYAMGGSMGGLSPQPRLGGGLGNPFTAQNPLLINPRMSKSTGLMMSGRSLPQDYSMSGLPTNPLLGPAGGPSSLMGGSSAGSGQPLLSGKLFARPGLLATQALPSLPGMSGLPTAPRIGGPVVAPAGGPVAGPGQSPVATPAVPTPAVSPGGGLPMAGTGPAAPSLGPVAPRFSRTLPGGALPTAGQSGAGTADAGPGRAPLASAEQTARTHPQVVKANKAFLAGRYHHSLGRLQVALRAMPNSRLIRHLLVRSLVATGSYVEAAFHVNHLLRGGPLAADVPSLYAAQQYGADGRWAAHEKRLAAHVASRSGEAEARLLHAYFLYAGGQGQRAGGALDGVQGEAHRTAVQRLRAAIGAAGE